MNVAYAIWISLTFCWCILLLFRFFCCVVNKEFRIPTTFRFSWVTVTRTESRRTWWRHQMETFSALLAICAGNSPIPGEFPAQMPVTRSFDVFYDLRLNKRLSKQSWGWWFETLSSPLWRHRNDPCCSSRCGQQSVVSHRIKAIKHNYELFISRYVADQQACYCAEGVKVST